jgi:ABC-type polysaccharide/polyol phosphate transport system ATPase subunit
VTSTSPAATTATTHQPAVIVDDVHKKFRLYSEVNRSLKIAVMRGKRAKYDEFEALKGISFDVPVGSTFGLVGGNGSGKSTLLKCLAKILRPEQGHITTHGRMAALLELGSGFHPELSGRDNVYLNGSILGLKKKEIEARFDDIVEFSGIGQFIDSPVKNYSSGMYVRLGFAVAINVDPDLLLVDEVLAVGDAEFQRKCATKFRELQDMGRTIVLVSHSMGQVRDMCDYAAWLDHGVLRIAGRTEAVVDAYMESQHIEDGRPLPVRASHVDLLDDHGSVVEQITSGDPLTVRVDVRSDEPVPDATLIVTLTTVDGMTLSSVKHRLDKVDGQLDARVRIAEVPLGGPRTFHVTARVVLDPDAKLAEGSEVFAPIEVKGVKGTGLVPLEVDWR